MKNLKQIIDSFDKEISEVKNAPMLYGESKAKFGYRYKEGHTIYTCYNIDKIRQFISTQITQLLEELREEDIDEKITDINYADGYNQRNQILNDKIDKILNK